MTHLYEKVNLFSQLIMSLKKYEQGSISGKVIIPHFTVSAYMLTLSSLQSYLPTTRS